MKSRVVSKETNNLAHQELAAPSGPITAALPAKTSMRIYAALVLLSMLSYLAVSRFIVNTVIVQGRSMAPTLNDGERYLLNRFAFLLRAPKRGDLVVIRDAGHNDFAVKRIVGLPGETITIRGGCVWVNGGKLEEQYLFPGTVTRTFKQANEEVTLGVDDYYVLGDNRPTSEDSRSYGPLHYPQIMGLLIR